MQQLSDHHVCQLVVDLLADEDDPLIEQPRVDVKGALAVLSLAGLVESGRAGREVRYRLTPAPLSEAMAWMAGVGAQWDARLARLERQLSR